MIKYEKHRTPTNPKDYFQVLVDMGENNWEFLMEKFGYMIFSKKVTGTKTIKEQETFKEFEEFILAFRKINNKGSYDKKLISKYKEVLKNYSHEFIMNNLKDYKRYLEVKKTCPAVMASTYLNQNRFLDKHEIETIVVDKWKNDLYEKYGLNAEQIENVKTEENARYAKHKKEITTGTLSNIIEYIINNGK